MKRPTSATRSATRSIRYLSKMKRPAKRMYHFCRGFFIEHDSRDKLWYATRNGVMSVFVTLTDAKDYCRWVTSTHSPALR